MKYRVQIHGLEDDECPSCAEGLDDNWARGILEEISLERARGVWAPVLIHNLCQFVSLQKLASEYGCEVADFEPKPGSYFSGDICLVARVV